MANLFDGIKLMSDDEIRIQISYFETVNITNAAKETGYRVISELADIANSLAEVFSAKAPFEYQVKKVSDMLSDNIIKLKTISRDELDIMLKNKINEVIRSVTGEIITEEDISEKTAYAMVNVAASGYGINKYMTTSHKIEEIRIHYNNAFIKNLQSYIQKMTEEDLKKDALIMDKSLGMAGIDTKRMVQKSLMPVTFNGMGVLKLLKKQKNTAKLEMAIHLLGIDAFNYQNAEIKTMYQVLKNLGSIRSLVLSRLIWFAANKYGKKFYVDTKLLPSYIPEDLKEEEEAQEKVYRSLLEQMDDVEKAVLKCQKEIELKKNALEESRVKFEKESEKFDDVSKRFSDLEEKKDDYINNRRSETETKSYYNQVNTVKAELDRASESYKRRKDKLYELAGDLANLNSKLEIEKNRQTAVESNGILQIEERSSALKKKWMPYYYKFKFDEDIFTKAVKIFTLNELLYIEEKLKELHESTDMGIYLKDNRYIYAYIGGRKPAVITYVDGIFTDISK